MDSAEGGLPGPAGGPCGRPARAEAAAGGPVRPRSHRSRARGWQGAPRAAQNARRRQAGTAPLRQPEVRRDELPLVLVAEDDEQIRSAVSELLREHGYRVREAGNGREVFGLALLTRPAAVLMDLAMPEVDGLTAAAALRDEEQMAGVRIVATSASWLADRGDLLARAGFDGALRKPFTAPQLLAELDRVLALG